MTVLFIDYIFCGYFLGNQLSLLIFHTYPACVQDSLLLMLMPVLGELAKNPPADPDKKRSLLGLCEKPSVSKVDRLPFFAEYMGTA